MVIDANDSPLQTDHKVHLGLGRDVKVTSLASLALQADLLLFGGNVLLHVLVGALEDDLALLLGLLTIVSGLFFSLSF